MKIISRKEAKEKGLKRYFTGKPCKNGHVSERYVYNSDCLECRRLHNDSDQFKEYQKEYYQKNKEYRKKYNKEYLKGWRDKNKDYMKDYMKEWCQNNKDYCKEYQRNRYATDNNYKIARVCRNMLKRTLKATSSTKDTQTYELLGYCNEDLIDNISSKLLEGMTWDNYGTEWHLDHIYPVSRYISEGVTDPSIINSLDNLIPMWAGDNLEKYSKTLEEYLDSNPEVRCTYQHFLEEDW